MDQSKKIRQADQVKSIEDVLSIAQPSDEELQLINYSGENTRMQGAKWHLLSQMICDVFNQGWIPNWSDYSQRKWYPIFDMDAGVGFSGSVYGYWDASATVGSRLCFETEKLSDMAAKKFPEVYRGFLSK